MKILSIDDMLEAASECELPSYTQHVAAIEEAATLLALALADHLKIGAAAATWEGKALSGTCAPFYPLKESDPCPEVIDEGDPGGDWEGRPSPEYLDMTRYRNEP